MKSRIETCFCRTPILSMHDIVFKQTSQTESPGNEMGGGLVKLYGGGPETEALASCDSPIDLPVDCHLYAALQLVELHGSNDYSQASASDPEA